MAAVVRNTVILVGFVVTCMVTAGFALADGDPASDFLVNENVYLPNGAPSQAAAASLARQVASVYAAGDRIKVAVVATRSDLGAIPSLFGKATDYATFLGEELDGVYVGPLLVVMPSGYGIYDGGRSVAAEQSVLQRLPMPASPRPDELVAAATTAVTEMLRADALKSADVLKPEVGLFTTKYAPGRLTLRFYVYDDSGHAAVNVTATRVGRLVFEHDLRATTSSFTKVETQTLRLPRGLKLTGARLCLTAVDPSGNRSSTSCRKIHS